MQNMNCIYSDGDAFGSFKHQIGFLSKYLGFYYVWHNKGTISVNKLIYAIKPNVLGRYEKYFISIITHSSSLYNKE